MSAGFEISRAVSIVSRRERERRMQRAVFAGFVLPVKSHKSAAAVPTADSLQSGHIISLCELWS